MRALVGSGLKLGPRPQFELSSREIGLTFGLGVAVIGWSMIEVAGVLGRISLGTSGRFYALTASLPALLGLTMMLARRKLPPAFSLAFAFTTLFAIALVGVPYAESSLTYAVGPAAIALAALVLRRWPAFGVMVLFVLTGASGSLIAFVHAPTGTISYLVVGGLWIGAVIGYLSGERRVSVRLWPGAVVLFAFLVMSLIEMALSGNFSGQLTSFRTNGLYMTAVLLLAYAPWRTSTYERIAKGVLIVAVLVGAYATLRLFTGPAAAERALLDTTPYAFVNGKLKLAGSFGGAAALGAWTAAMMPFCAALALALRGRWQLAGLAGFALCGVGMFGSQLRTALVAVTFGLVIVLIVFQLARALPGLRLGTTVAAIGIVLGAGVVGIVATGGGSSSHSYKGITQPSRDLSVTDRYYKWKEAIRDLRGKPFGYGIGTATSGYATQDKSAQGRFTLNVGAYSIDNGYLKIALEQGYYAMALFAGALLLIFLAIARRAVGLLDPTRAAISLGAAGTLASFWVLLLADAFQEGLPALGVWIVVGLGAAEASRRVATENENARVAAGPPRPVKHQAPLGAARS